MYKALALLAILAFSAQASSSLDFLIIGDWGGDDRSPYTQSGQRAVAAAMGKTASAEQSDFVLALGDNFYTYGITTNENDPRFQETFEECYTASSLENIPFYVVAGNHDWRGNVTAEIYYSNHSSRWVYPNYYYTFSYPVGSKSVQFVMIDTVMLSGNVADQEDVTAKPLGAENESDAADQLAWIEDTMKASTADYLFVAGHYPVYSACSHGNTQELINDIKPLLEKYGAHYLSGHDHCQEYINPGTGVQYILQGNSDNCCYDAPNKWELPNDSLKYIVESSNRGSIIGGYAQVHITETEFIVNFIDDKGRIGFTTPSNGPRRVSEFLTI